MNLTSESHPFGVIISVADSRIDAPVAIRFKDQMRLATEGVDGRIILDLTHVDFVDSSGLGAIVAAFKQLGPEQTLELAALSGTVAKVFRLTRMDKVFAIHETLEQAVGAYANAS